MLLTDGDGDGLGKRWGFKQTLGFWANAGVLGKRWGFKQTLGF
jgi:hypothetical protein